MTRRVHDALVRTEEVIDTEYAPERMTPEEALEYLRVLIDNTKYKIKSLKRENDVG